MSINRQKLNMEHDFVGKNAYGGFTHIATFICVFVDVCVSDTGADPGVGKGRGTNRLSCKWLGRARFSSSVLHF